MTPPQITSETTIREALERYPATRPVLTRLGLDRCCCYGMHSIAVAALARGLDPIQVLADVRKAAAPGA